MSYQFVIVGACLSGLSKAFFIKHLFPKAKITLIEQSNRIGGMIQTRKENQNQFIFEEGPHSIKIGRYDRPLFYMIDKIGLYPELVTSIQQPYNYIYWKDELKSVPQRMNFETISRFIKDHGKEELLNLIKAYPKLLLNKQVTDNLGEYLDEILGKELTKKYAETVYYGSYGESVYNLSRNMCFDKIYMQSYDEVELKKDLIYDKEFEQIRDKKLRKAHSYRFTYGLESLPKRLLRYLKDNLRENFEIYLDTKVQELNIEQKELIIEKEDKNIQKIYYDKLLLNVPSSQIATMIQNQSLDKLKEDLKKIKYTSLITRNICWDQKILPRNFRGSGYLINPNENKNILGMVTDSLQFPMQYPQDSTSVTVLSLKDVEDDQILKELSIHLGMNIQDPKMIIKKNWMDCWIKWNPGYFDKMMMIEKELEEKSIIIGANHFTMSIPELVYLSYSKMKQLYV
ncbi:unnamed protein product [Paramecium sonneborni]|uniref:Protoporphyrinogen oxidase n=1 Tax=Paramecium sonneborni TaxID=65129 RepID=A0A8S1P608_9CILI|nr:unnamed protein product [Paramecium sonneborni]